MIEAFQISSGFVLGTLIGSYLATLLIRWPAGRSAAAGRSACDACRRTLRPSELVPVLSHLLSGGRCRTCKAAIDPKHLAVELAAGAVGAVAMVAHPGWLGLVTAALGWWLLIAALIDLYHHWLPDELTLPLIPLGLLAGWAGYGPDLEARLIGAAAGFLVLWLIAYAYRKLRHREGMGGGDPKLFAALGAWLGWMHLPMVLLGAGLVGIAAIAAARARGQAVSATDRLPLGTLMILPAWAIWLVIARQPLDF